MGDAVIGGVLGLVGAGLYYMIHRSRSHKQEEHMYTANWYILQTEQEEQTIDVKVTDGEFQDVVLRISNLVFEGEDENTDDGILSYQLDVVDGGQSGYDIASWNLDKNAEEGTPEYRLVVLSQNIVDGIVRLAVEHAEQRAEDDQSTQ